MSRNYNRRIYCAIGIQTQFLQAQNFFSLTTVLLHKRTKEKKRTMSSVGIPIDKERNHMSADGFNSNGRWKNSRANVPQQQQQQQEPRTAPQAPVQEPYAPPQYDSGDVYVSSAPATAARNVREFGVHETFKWNASAAKTNVNSVKAKPLIGALKSKNLSTQERMNVRGLYLASAHNASQAPIGVLLRDVNGRDLNRVYVGNGRWATFTMQPRETLDYRLINDGRGLRLASNPLTIEGDYNSQMKPEEMLTYAEARQDYMDENGEPTHYLVDVDLSAFDPNNTAHSQSSPSQKLNQLNPLGKFVYANAKVQFNKTEAAAYLHGLPELNEHDFQNQPFFGDIHITEDSFARHRGKFKALIPRDRIEQGIENYTKDVSSTAQPTIAKNHAIEVFRIGANNAEHIGDMSSELNVTKGDLDRAKQVNSGVHLQFNYEIQHNGKPEDAKLPVAD